MENLNINTYHSTDEINPEVWDVLLLRRKLDLLLRTGKLLMESAADTNRIERNMKRVAAFMNIPEEKLHIDIRWTMIMVNVSDEQHSFSKFQKCENHAINMTMISQISKLSFKATEENYSLDDYEKELEKSSYPPKLHSLPSSYRCRICLWRILQTIRLRLDRFPVRLHLCFHRFPNSGILRQDRYQCLHEYRYCSICLHLLGIRLLFLRPILYPLSSAIGLCLIHCSRRSAD